MNVAEERNKQDHVAHCTVLPNLIAGSQSQSAKWQSGSILVEVPDTDCDSEFEF